MEKNEILKEANEALQRTLLMMNYDMKKTLSENVEVISEQGNEDQEIANLLYAGAHGSPGTKEDKLVSGFSKIKNADQYNRVEKLYASAGREKTLQDMLRNELGSSDIEDLEKIKASLSKAGVNLTYKDTVNFNYGVPTKSISDSDTITISPIKTGVGVDTKTQETGKSYYTGIFTCIEKNTSTQEDTYQNQKIVRVFSKSSLKVYWADGHYTEYVYNPSTNKVGNETGRGNFKCKGTTKTETKGNGKSPVTAITDKDILSKLKFDYQYPGDKSYTYAYVEEPALKESENISEGTWYAKNNKTGKVFDISKNYPKVADNLQKSAVKSDSTTSGTTVSGTTTNSGQTTTNDTKTDVNIPEPQGAERPTPPSDKNLAASQTPQNESLKKTLKRNLSEIKETKQNLIMETNIIEKRFNFIVESKSFETEEEQISLVESIISEIGYLKSQNYTSQAINEGLFSMLGSLLGGTAGAVPAVFGEYIASWLTKTLGIPQDSYMNSVIVSLVGNLNISDYDRFFSDCRFASNKIADSLIEGYVLQLQNQKGANTGASGFIVSALRNSVIDYFTEDKNSLIQILEDKIGEFICPKLSKLSGVISDKTQDMKAKMTT